MKVKIIDPEHLFQPDLKGLERLIPEHTSGHAVAYGQGEGVISRGF